MKTAGTSIEIALSEFLGPKDVITPIAPRDAVIKRNLGFPSHQNNYIPFSSYKKKDFFKLLNFKRPKFYNHISALEVIRSIGQETWDEYYTFCVERNPWDKLISFYYWTGGDEKYGSISSFLHSPYNLQRIQNYRLYSSEQKILTDRIFHFEKLKELESTLSDLIKAKLTLSQYKAKVNSNRPKKHYSQILKSEEKKIIERAFRNEIDHMNYQYETI